MRRPKYKELYEKALKRIDHITAASFNISYHREGDRDCEHNFDDWRLESEGGMGYCVWVCSLCGMEVNQFLAERIRPENVPTDPSVSSWRE